MPFYLSGTKARASGWVRTSRGHLTEAKLSIQGQLVASWSYDGGPNVVFENSQAVMFDSSHFPAGSDVEVRVWGRNSWGDTVEASDAARVKNRIVGFNKRHWAFYPPGGNGVAALLNEMAGSNYQSYTSTFGWDKAQVRQNLHNPGIWYVHSHGETGLWHQTDVESTDEPEAFWVNNPEPWSYAHGRDMWNGEGLPPFNSTEHPYVAFALCDWCESGIRQDIQVLLYPYLDAYSTQITDQALIAWPGCIFVNDAYNRIWWLIRPMRQGKTVDQAVQILLQGNRLENHPVRIHSWFNLVDTTDEILVIGDKYTRVKGVYTGNNMTSAQSWYRKLQ
jgi:hypothetical protein